MNMRPLLFAGLVLAAAVAAAADAPAGTCGAERLRIGLISDIHIRGGADEPWLEEALRCLDALKVDGVVASGDLTDFGLRQQLQIVADTWFRVFPGGQGSDGRPVANLMIYGDHDLAKHYWERPEAKAVWPDESVRRSGAIFYNNPGRIWNDCFREPWAPIRHKTVKGCHFVLSHFAKQTYTPGLEEFFATNRVETWGDVVFCVQHRPPRQTALFSKYPNVFAIAGHCHRSCADASCLWQGAFTSLQVPTLKEQREGYLLRVCERAVVVERWNFKNGRKVGADWIVETRGCGK